MSGEKLTRAQMDTCGTCKFVAVSERSYAGLECRRRPPIIVEHRSSCARWKAPGWPDVYVDHWCGEYIFSGRLVADPSFRGGDRRPGRTALKTLGEAEEEKCDLQSLLTRLEAATGPDRELDAAIFNALVDDGGRKAFRVTDWTRGRAPRLDRYHDGWLSGKSEDDIYADNLVRYTASLDAALALVERVLPGWTMDCDATAPECGIDWSLHEPRKNGRRFTGTAEAHSLALLTALLRALIAQEATDA